MISKQTLLPATISCCHNLPGRKQLANKNGGESKKKKKLNQSKAKILLRANHVGSTPFTLSYAPEKQATTLLEGRVWQSDPQI